MKKGIIAMVIYSSLAVLGIPVLVTLCCNGLGTPQPTQAEALYGVADLAPLETELEEYVVGVVAAEMPAAFPLEALKAQAVAARTYQIQQQKAAGTTEVLYDVGQAYCTVEEQKQKWGKDYTVYGEKVRKAVQETAGEIMLYNGEPILAAFHAQSSGKTETAENVWSSALPYLQSVDSAVDTKAPNHKTEVVLPAKTVMQALCGDATEKRLTILGRTEAGTVTEVQAGQTRLTGRKVRELLGLRSANFIIAWQGENICFTTYGYGHGAGMSQYGASFLAEAGSTYRDILKHYYTDITFAKIEAN